MSELPPLPTVIISTTELRYWKYLGAKALPALCRENHRVAGERDQLRDAIVRALHDLLNGWPEAAIDTLARAIGEP